MEKMVSCESSKDLVLVLAFRPFLWRLVRLGLQVSPLQEFGRSFQEVEIFIIQDLEENFAVSVKPWNLLHLYSLSKYNPSATPAAAYPWNPVWNSGSRPGNPCMVLEGEGSWRRSVAVPRSRELVKVTSIGAVGQLIWGFYFSLSWLSPDGRITE